MFFTYLRRELRRRSRQAAVIALGLAVGIGLVISVSALSAGVKNAQSDVLHSLYGVGTDVTVTQSPSAGSGNRGSFRFSGPPGSASGSSGKATTIDVDTLHTQGVGTLAASSVADVSRLRDVAAASGGLSLVDTKISGKIPAFKRGTSGSGGQFSGPPSGFQRVRGSLAPTSITVDGVQVIGSGLGPLSGGTVTSGRTFRASDATHNVAVVDSDYAKQHRLKPGSTVTLAKKTFTVIGVARVPAGTSGANVYIPLARAQALSGETGKVSTVYVAATNSAAIGSVKNEISGLLPKATVTDSASLASEITGSMASAGSLADTLGRWLAVAVLLAAFLLASLLTISAVTRRVREFGTLKALGWRSRRVVGQVVGESLVIGLVGGVVGVGLGYLGATLISTFTHPLSAALAPTTGSATPGGARTFFNPGQGFPGGGSRGSGGNPFSGSFQRVGQATQDVTVHLTAPVTLTVILVAVGLAVAGGLIAGLVGSWRAARLRPAAAMSRIG